MAEESDEKNWSQITSLNFIMMAKGIQQNQRNCLPSRSKVYPKRVEMICLSDINFKPYIVHMASSLSTAVPLCLL